MRPALGRGLGALISEETAATVAQKAPARSTLPISSICSNKNQPRKTFIDESLKELAASIRERGVLQPILVKVMGNEQRIPSDGQASSAGSSLIAQNSLLKYEIIAGERRWRAAQLAGLTEIPAIIKSGTDIEHFQMSLIENVQREDLNPIDQANGFRRLIDDYSMTQDDLARIIGKDRTVVANTIRLLNLPQEIREALVKGDLSAGHARALLALENDTARLDLFKKISEQQLTVRAVEQAVREQKKVAVKGHTRGAAGENKSPEAKAIEHDLQQTMARKVELQVSGPAATKGWVRLEFYSPEDLEHLVNQLKQIPKS
jgi:ParB family chromosome partitioning protein